MLRIEQRSRNGRVIGHHSIGQWPRTILGTRCGHSLSGSRDGSSGRGVTACRAALGEFTRDRAPLDWAMAQNNLGNALGALAEREGGTAHLEEAVATYRAALEE